MTGPLERVAAVPPGGQVPNGDPVMGGGSSGRIVLDRADHQPGRWPSGVFLAGPMGPGTQTVVMPRREPMPRPDTAGSTGPPEVLTAAAAKGLGTGGPILVRVLRSM